MASPQACKMNQVGQADKMGLPAMSRKKLEKWSFIDPTCSSGVAVHCIIVKLVTYVDPFYLYFI